MIRFYLLKFILGCKDSDFAQMCISFLRKMQLFLKKVFLFSSFNSEFLIFVRLKYSSSPLCNYKFRGSMNIKKRKIRFVVNPISGTQNKKGITELIPRFVDSERYDWEITPTLYQGHAEVLAREAVRWNCE